MDEAREMLKNEKGATVIEYGLIAAILAVSGVVAMQELGIQIDAALVEVRSWLNS